MGNPKLRFTQHGEDIVCALTKVKGVPAHRIGLATLYVMQNQDTHKKHLGVLSWPQKTRRWIHMEICITHTEQNG